MASYDGTDFDRMRQEAVARAREMQRRAQGLVSGSADGGQHTPSQEQTHQQELHTSSPERQAAETPVRPMAGGLLSSLLGPDNKIDEEKALIGMLIYILYKNGADVKLMLALGYLLL